jgi:hypothetical protein
VTAFIIWSLGACGVPFVAAIVVLIVQRRARQQQRAGHDADILAVAEEGLADRPELADDGEAVERTLAAIHFTEVEIAALADLAAADGQQGAEPTAFLVEIYNAQTRYRFPGIYGEDGQP